MILSIFPHPLGLDLCPGPDPIVNIEPRVPPGEEAFCPFGAEELLVDEKAKNLSGKKLSQPRVVNVGDFMEEAFQFQHSGTFFVYFHKFQSFGISALS